MWQGLLGIWQRPGVNRACCLGTSEEGAACTLAVAGGGRMVLPLSGMSAGSSLPQGWVPARVPRVSGAGLALADVQAMPAGSYRQEASGPA